jgi:hypothetical protein
MENDDTGHQIEMRAPIRAALYYNAIKILSNMSTELMDNNLGSHRTPTTDLAPTAYLRVELCNFLQAWASERSSGTYR